MVKFRMPEPVLPTAAKAEAGPPSELPVREIGVVVTDRFGKYED